MKIMKGMKKGVFIKNFMDLHVFSSWTFMFITQIINRRWTGS